MPFRFSMLLALPLTTLLTSCGGLGRSHPAEVIGTYRLAMPGDVPAIDASLQLTPDKAILRSSLTGHEFDYTVDQGYVYLQPTGGDEATRIIFQMVGPDTLRGSLTPNISADYVRSN
jgi:hypothetical protein